MQLQRKIDESGWKRMIEGLPFTTKEISKAIGNTLNTDGYIHLRWPMSMESYEQIAGQLGTIILRSDVKVDMERAGNQEQVRNIRGRGGIYSPTPLHLHTDPNADLVSWYCVEQDEGGGPMLMLDAGNLEEEFSEEELEVLGRIKLWSPSRESETDQEVLTLTPMLRREGGRNKIFYASWLLCKSYDDEATRVLGKFADFVKHAEETRIITLPVQRQETIFIDNRRMLHGRGALPTTSRRHLVRLYLRAA